MNMNVELYGKIERLHWLFHKQHLKSHAADGPTADASRGQGRILAFLKMKDGISTKDLSYLLGIRVSSLNELISKLEKAGYITRKPSETDKRVMLIYLTDKGRQEEEVETDSRNLFSGLSLEEQTAFGDYLDRIIAAFEEELETTDERDRMFDWMEAARERMGTEHFERLITMRGMRRGFPGFEREGHGGSFHGFDPDRRGPAPGFGDNRFDSDCDGPGPNGRTDFPLDNNADNKDR